MANYDYEFELGKDRRLKGHGPRGLIALALLLACLFAIVWTMESPLANGMTVGFSQATLVLGKLF